MTRSPTTPDDLTRRSIIAAHDAECAWQACDGDVSTYGALTKREQAIVDRWRADRDDYQGRYETSHDSRMHAESLLDAMTREARLSREATGQAVDREKRARDMLTQARVHAAHQAGVTSFSSAKAWRRQLDILRGETTDGR